MELGEPQLYAEVNRVARDLDHKSLKELGPFIKALGVISLRAQHFKSHDDLIKTGQMYESNELKDNCDKYLDFENVDLLKPGAKNMAGSFLLFRGT